MKELLAINFEDCDLREGVLSCKRCGEKMKSPKRAKSLETHLMTIIGFIAYHGGCLDELENTED